MKVRLATPDDLEQGVEMFNRFISETIYSRFSINIAKTLTWLSYMVRNGFVAVAEVEMAGKSLVVGALALEPSSFPFTDDLYLSQRFFYVLPEYRVTGAAAALVTSAKEYSKRTKIPVFLDHAAGTEVELKDKFFERAGLTKVGSTFLFDGAAHG